MASNPYVNKVVYGNDTLIDLTDATATADKILQGYTAYGADGSKLTGTATGGGSGDGHVWQDAQGYVHLSDEAGTHVEVDALTVSSGGTYTAPTGHAYSPVTVSSGNVTAPSTISGTSATVSTGTNTLTLSKTVSVTPNVTTSGYITSGTAGNSSVSLTASVNTRSSSDLTVSGATVTAPSGYYASNATKTVASGTAGTPTASKGTVSNHSISVTPKVTNVTGYITGSTKTGTAVTVSASELVSGTKSITENGTGIDVTNFQSVNVAVPSSGGDITTVTVTVTTSLSDLIMGPTYDGDNNLIGTTLRMGSWSASGFSFHVLYNPNFTQNYGNVIQYVSESPNRTITMTNNMEYDHTETIGNCTIYVLNVMGDNASFTVT